MREISTIIKLEQNSLDRIFIDMAICNRTERIAGLLRDNSISFWELADNYRFEKKLKCNAPNLQINIWCIDSLERWITIDKTNSIYVWHLQSEEPLFRRAHS